MKNNNKITIKNKLPNLIEAVCSHKDCPGWLSDAIFVAFNEQNRSVTFSETYWKNQLEMIADYNETEDVLNAEVLK